MNYRPNHNNEEVNLEASYDFDSDIDIWFDADVDVYFDLDVDHDIDVCVDIDGNDASFQIDLQAFGDDSATELNLVVLVSDDYSSIAATGWAGVA